MPFIIPNQTSTALQRPVSTSGWTRPADWITIVDTPNEVQFLFSDAATTFAALSTEFSRTASQNIYIDWGDGTTDTISSTSISTNHTYTSGGTPCSLGYNTWKIRVYGDVGTTLTNIGWTWNTNQTLGFVASPTGLLEAVYGDGTQTIGFNSLFVGGGTRPQFSFLTYVKLPSVINTSGNIFQNAFGGCFNLRKVVMPISAPNATAFNTCFSTCYSLSEPIVFPQDALGITSLNGAFTQCWAITSITLPPTLNNNTSLNNTFRDCYSLTTLNLPANPLCLDWQSAFSQCRSLLSFELKSFPTTAGTILMNNLFLSCVSLEYIKLPTTTSGNLVDISNIFQNCYALKNCVLPTNLNASAMPNAFFNCYSLTSLIMPTTMPNIVSMSASFQNCSSLQQITLPTSVGATINLTNAFNSCFSLSEITIPSSYIITQLSQTFLSCGNLRSVVLPNNAQNSLTTLQQVFQGCSNLQSVVMPTSMNALTTMANAFNNCYNLKRITLPSSLNATTTLQTAFANCYTLSNIVMPTSMTSLSVLSGAFQNCFALEELTLPATAASITAMNTMVNTCSSLNKVVFPTTQMNSVANLAGCLQANYSLTGLTNTDKIGNLSTASTIYIDAINNNDMFQLPTLDFSCKFSVLRVEGRAASLTKLTSLRLRNNGAGQYAGANPQINISFTSLSQAALVQVFNDLPTITSKTINITSALGAAALTPAERAIATGKGWTIVG